MRRRAEAQARSMRLNSLVLRPPIAIAPRPTPVVREPAIQSPKTIPQEFRVISRLKREHTLHSFFLISLRAGDEIYDQRFQSAVYKIDADERTIEQTQARAKRMKAAGASAYELELENDITWMQLCGVYDPERYHFEMPPLVDKGVTISFQHPEVNEGQLIEIFSSPFEVVEVPRDVKLGPRAGFMQFTNALNGNAVDPLGNSDFCSRVVVSVDYSEPNKLIVFEISFELLYAGLLKLLCGHVSD